MKLPLMLGAALLVAACANPAVIERAKADRAGFVSVEEGARKAVGAVPVWNQSAADIEATERRVHALVHGKTISADTAVQVALINNRALQASFAELGLSSTDLWEVAMGPVPTLGVSVSGLAGDVTRTLEATVAGALLDLATTKPRTQLAEVRFRQAELAALAQTIDLAVETRRAWIESVGAFEAAALIGQTHGTAEAASELAVQLGRTGAMNKADQAREHAFTAELAAERAAARLEAQLAKEKLLRLMGLWGSATTVYVPDALPALPRGPRAAGNIEQQALANRVDLAAGKLELQAIALDYRLTGKTRMVSDAALVAGVELERANGETEATPALALDFEIPLYDTGPLVSKRGRMAYLQAANTLAQQAIDARSDARMAYKAVTGRHNIARHWRDQVLPLRRQIDEEALLSYNGMLTSTFELIADAQEGLDSRLSAAEAKRDYWLAETEATAAIWGGSVTLSKGGEE
ncbi:TolC family protein [Tropicibacter sp. S64]|uniref:TolC family protein n=1 Tax=Tropicibacter sp. S64 TaxID=3415122 RepID=UPI003C7A1D6E